MPIPVLRQALNVGCNFKTTITMKIISLIIVLGICRICLGQDTCVTTINYGNNPNAGKFAKVNGINMYYETYGDPLKQPLLLIHGNGGYINAERCQIEYFKNQYYVVIADSRFQGKSDNGDMELTFDVMTKDYNALLDHLRIDSAYIIGQSDGGIIGLLLAINYPKKVKKLIATSPNIRPDSNALYNWLIVDTKKTIDLMAEKIAKGDTTNKTLRSWAVNNLDYKYPNLADEDLHKIKAEVLMMASDADAIKLEHILKMYQNIPKAQLFIMPGATHFMLRQEYALFNQIAERFLNNPFKRPTTKAIMLGH
jgi:pimeloyl-ACP methyl ester carboxylesterase